MKNRRIFLRIRISSNESFQSIIWTYSIMNNYKWSHCYQEETWSLILKFLFVNNERLFFMNRSRSRLFQGRFERHHWAVQAHGAHPQCQHSVPNAPRPDQEADGHVHEEPGRHGLSHPGHPDRHPRMPAPVQGPPLELLKPRDTKQDSLREHRLQPRWDMQASVWGSWPDAAVRLGLKFTIFWDRISFTCPCGLM